MLTTVGTCALAMLRKVAASIGPASGALFIAGTPTVWADDAGEDPLRRDHHADGDRRDGDEDGIEKRGLAR